MGCERPYKITNPRYKDMSKTELSFYCRTRLGLDLVRPPDFEIQVPCGRCHSCQKSRLQQFRFRLLYELQKYPNSLFITLSFCDSALEEYKDNYNKAICQFMDAMRKRYGKELRHFFVCEYGTEHGRPHYHGILIGVPHLDFYEVESIWNRGNGRKRSEGQDYIQFFKKPRGIIYLESIRDTQKCTSYICKYMTKEYSPDKPTPRVIVSRGFGSGFLETHESCLCKSTLSSVVSYQGYPTTLPRYLRDKLFTSQDKNNILRKMYLEDNQRWYCDGVEYQKKSEYNKALKKYHLKNQTLGLSPSDRFIRELRKIKKPKIKLEPNYNFDYEST